MADIEGLAADFFGALAAMEERVGTERRIEKEDDYLKKCVLQAKHPLDELISIRHKALIRCEKGYKGKKSQIIKLNVLHKCKSDIIYFVNNWAWIFNPWLTRFDQFVEGGFPSTVPFILFPRAKEYLLWREDLYRRQRIGLVYKARELGVSWDNCVSQSWHWLFEDGFQGRMGSRKEALVDSKRNPDSLFWKIRFIIYHTPKWFRHPDMSAKRNKHDTLLSIENPSNGAVLGGEGGDNMGTGGRAPQPLGAKLLTPQGWSTIGKIKAGDFVIGSNGKPTKVTKVHPIAFEPTYRVFFSDGSSTECAESHLWHVIDRMNQKTLSRRRNHTTNRQYAKTHKVLSTKEILKRGLKKSNTHQFQIPMVKPISYDKKAFPLDPYVVGALLGDGSVCNLRKNSPTLTNTDKELVALVEERLPSGCSIKEIGGYQYRLTDEKRFCGGWHIRSRMKEAIRKSGIAGMKGHNKRIPEQYKRGSIGQRLDLLRGLMDTDGWVSRPTKPHFGSTSQGLVGDVREIVQSLGGTAVVTVRPSRTPRLFPSGNFSATKTFYNMVVRLPNGMNPFMISRKADKYEPKAKYKPIRNILSMEFVGHIMSRCISVDAKDGLYVTDSHILTHNSMYDVDEWAKVEHDRMVETGLSNNARCRIYTGTPNGMDNDYAQKFHSGKVEIFDFNWTHDPRKNQDWYENFNEEHDEAIVAQEIDRKFDAMNVGQCIPPEWVAASVELYERIQSGTIEYAPDQDKVSGMDVAAGGRNRTVMLWRDGIVVRDCYEWNERNTTTITEMSGSKAEDVGVSTFNFDPISCGIGVRSAFDKLKEQGQGFNFEAVGVDYRGAASEEPLPGDTKPARERCINRRAELAVRLRKRFEKTYEFINKRISHPISDMIAIPNHPKLRSQLSLPDLLARHGRWRLEDKESMSKRGIDSPDYFDACCLCFAEEAIEKKVIKSFSYLDCKNFNIMWNAVNRQQGSHYVAIHHEDAKAGALGAVWWHQTHMLQVYDEILASTPTVVGMIQGLMTKFGGSVHEYIGNREMFGKDEEDSLFTQYLDHNILVYQNIQYNEISAIAQIEEMFSMNQIQIHPRCRNLKGQIGDWDRVKGGISKLNKTLAYALCSMVNFLEEQDVFMPKAERRSRYTRRQMPEEPMVEQVWMTKS